jgi:hypothetical protein
MNRDPNHQGAALSLLLLYENELIEFKNVIEFLALFTGDKKVVRLVLTNKQANRVGIGLNLHFPYIQSGSSKFVLHEVFRSSRWDSFHERRYKAFEEDEDVRAHFFGQRQFVELAIEAEDDKADALELGELFGIPECCARQYHESLNTSGKWMPNYLRTSKVISVADAISNRFSSIVGYQMGFHNDYFPCNFSCEKTLQICNTNRERLLHHNLDALVELADSNSLGTAIALNDHVYYRNSGGVPDSFSSRAEFSTAGFKALTPSAPYLPPIIRLSDYKTLAADRVEGGATANLSVCFFDAQRDRS